MRQGLRQILEDQADFEIVNESSSGIEAVEAARQLKPDVAIVDLSLKGVSGLELIKSLKNGSPRVRVIVLSMHDEKLYAERAIRAGARGYVMKRETTKEIVDAIKQVFQGKLYVSEQMASLFSEKFVGMHNPTGNSPVELLSDREFEVFSSLGQGLSTRQIAETLNVSIKTVQAYCARIKQKLKLSSATELLHEAIRWHEQQLNN